VKPDERPGADDAYRPGTTMQVSARAFHTGFLFVVNRDDTGTAQLVPWNGEAPAGTTEGLVGQAAVTGSDAEFPLKVASRTTARNGREYWKAYLFRNREQALAFAKSWLTIIDGKGRTKLNDNRVFGPAPAQAPVPLDSLYTSETSYAVAAR